MMTKSKCWGLPQPFHDDDGFPLSLRHIRAEVEARGGEIVGSGLLWRITHPDPRLPDIVIKVYGEGEVLIDAGGDLGMDVFCSEAWRVGPEEHPWTHLEDVLLAFLLGGFTREVWRDKEGKVVYHYMYLEGPHGDEAGGNTGPIDDSLISTGPVTYPAWPPPRLIVS